MNHTGTSSHNGSYFSEIPHGGGGGDEITVTPVPPPDHTNAATREPLAGLKETLKTK